MEHGYLVNDPYRGIYYVEGNVLFPTQIVVIKGLDLSEHIWLGSLSDQLKKQSMDLSWGIAPGAAMCRHGRGKIPNAWGGGVVYSFDGNIEYQLSADFCSGGDKRKIKRF